MVRPDHVAARIEALACAVMAATLAAMSGSLQAPTQFVGDAGLELRRGGLIVSEKVSLQSASRATLATLPGIGPVLSSRIVDARTRTGCFRDLSSLTQVPGIGPKTLETLIPYAYAGCAP